VYRVHCLARPFTFCSHTDITFWHTHVYTHKHVYNCRWYLEHVNQTIKVNTKCVIFWNVKILAHNSCENLFGSVLVFQIVLAWYHWSFLLEGEWKEEQGICENFLLKNILSCEISTFKFNIQNYYFCYWMNQRNM
jgi:hypothetical protein